MSVYTYDDLNDYWEMIFDDIWALVNTSVGIPQIFYPHLDPKFRNLYIILKTLKDHHSVDIDEIGHIPLNQDDLILIAKIGAGKSLDMSFQDRKLIYLP
jgi:hypothetical protein